MSATLIDGEKLPGLGLCGAALAAWFPPSIFLLIALLVSAGNAISKTIKAELTEQVSAMEVKPG
jgi:hypothetical protein